MLKKGMKTEAMIDHDISSFGALLNMFRKRTSLTQQRLAEAVGMHRHAISRWEQGEVLPASKAIVLELARHLRLNDLEARQLLEASLTSPLPLWGVPFPRNLFFTGREDTLKLLHKHLHVDQIVTRTPVYALQGLGGVGKTQTALEYAYRHALEYSAIFWIEAETVERVLFSLQRIAEILQLPEREAQDQHQVIEAVQRWLVTHQEWLLIWDNLEDLGLPSRLLPLARQGAILLTTRRQALGTFARGIDLLPLDLEEGIALLLRRAKVLEADATHEQVQELAEHMPTEYVAASELVELLGGLPLALDQAGAYLEETGCSLVSYLHRYKQQRSSLLARRGVPKHDPGGAAGGDHPQSVTTTFLLAQEQVEQRQTAAADLLRVCAFLHPEAIPEELFSAGALHSGPELASVVTDPVRFDLAIAILRHLSLVQRQTRAHTLSLHRLVQVVLREQMGPVEERLWSERVIRMVNAAFPKGDFPTWSQCERVLAQALACVSLLVWDGNDLPEAGELLTKAGYYLLGRGRFDEASPLLEQATLLGEHYYGPDHPALLPRLKNQAQLLWKQGKHACAEKLLADSLAIEEQHLESPYIEIGETLNNLALLYWEQGKYEQAEPLLQRALQARVEHAGYNDLGTASTLNNLALLYWKLGKYTQAEPLFQQAAQIKEHLLGPEHPDTGFLLYNLAVLYRDQGKYVQAEPLFQRALQIQEQSLGPYHPDVADSLVSLAVLYRDQDKYEQAEPLFRRSLQIRQQVLGKEHFVVARTLYNLATLYMQQYNYEQAEQFFQQALCIQEQALGTEHQDTGRSLYGLATLYTHMGKYTLAEQLFQQALQIRQHALGEEHPFVAETLHGMATLYTRQGCYALAEQLYEQALHIYEQRLGTSHPKTAKSRAALLLLSEKMKTVTTATQ